MTKKKYQRYSAEFKSLALKRASEDGVTDKEVCEDQQCIPIALGGRRTWCQNEGYQGHAAIICDYFRGHEDYLASFCRE